jgi:formate-dependent phosphoribosylglycinamide formyltransferase (GAR transformylase)
MGTTDIHSFSIRAKSFLGLPIPTDTVSFHGAGVIDNAPLRGDSQSEDSGSVNVIALLTVIGVCQTFVGLFLPSPLDWG